MGLAAYYRTGTPLTRYGFSNAYSRYEVFLTPRGAEGRGPADYEADLHLGYPLSLGPVTVNFLVDVFKLLNAQRPLLLDERYNIFGVRRRELRLRIQDRERRREEVQFLLREADLPHASKAVETRPRVSF